MEAISEEFVQTYIKDAISNQEALGPQRLRPIEIAAIIEAAELSGLIKKDKSYPNDVLFLFHSWNSPKASVSSEDRSLIDKWKLAIILEIREALCSKSARYKKEVEAVGGNVQVLIVAIATYVARSIGASAIVVAALVAALLRLILMIGLKSFCEAMKT